VDFLTPEEEAVDLRTGHLRFNIELNQAAFAQLGCEKQLVIVPGATHLFEEPNALEEVARLARVWFETHLAPAQASDHSSPNGPGGSVSALSRVHLSRTE
jgi:hypothetical protein